MKQKSLNVIIGICVVALGLVLLGNNLGFFSINIFFEGWWTLFIIIPSIIGLFRRESIPMSLVFLSIGVGLLLTQQDIITNDLLWKIVIPEIIIIIGITTIISQRHKVAVNSGEFEASVPPIQADYICTAIFAGENRRFIGENFNGAKLTAIFGGLELDLREAVLTKDVVIDSTAIFGGCEVKAPANVNVKVSSTSIFGGSDNKVSSDNPSIPTIYVRAFNLFGGFEIK